VRSGAAARWARTSSWTATSPAASPAPPANSRTAWATSRASLARRAVCRCVPPQLLSTQVAGARAVSSHAVSGPAPGQGEMRTARRGPRRRPRQSSASARRVGCSCSSTRTPPLAGAPQEKKWWSKMIRPVVGNAARGPSQTRPATRRASSATSFS
jgi:hypothetical protein